MTAEDRVAVTGLYVPADRLDRLEKALNGDADVVLADLEDAVAAGAKESARSGLAAALGRLMDATGRTADGSVQVRINAPGTRWHAEDLAAIAALPQSVGVRVPKVSDPGQLLDVRRAAEGRPLHVLIETPLGVEKAFELTRSGIATLGLGEADLVSALGVRGPEDLGFQRARVVNAAAAAELPSPWMSAYTAHSDLEGLAASCAAGRQMGFIGRAAIHPRQLPVIRRAFAPSSAETERARQILDGMDRAEAAGSGVWILRDGSFADAAMVGAARRTLALEAACGRTSR